ncbi:MAG: RDD family protein [Terrimesophilobacter sp.]
MVAPYQSISTALDDFGDGADELITGEAVALDLRPASFVLRGAGAAIDWVVYFGLWILIVVTVNSPVFVIFFDAAMLRAITVVALVLSIVVIPTVVELLTRGRSLGKLAIGARIVRDDGGAIGFRHAFIRALLGVMEIFGTLGGLAALTGLLNSRSKRLGDLVAGTYSQHERISRYTPEVFGVPVELVGWAQTADVAKLPDPLARRISQFLASAGGLTPDSRARVSQELAAEASIYVSPIPPAHPELLLAAVSALRRDREFTALQLQRTRLDQLTPALKALPHDFPDRR